MCEKIYHAERGEVIKDDEVVRSRRMKCEEICEEEKSAAGVMVL